MSRRLKRIRQRQKVSFPSLHHHSFNTSVIEVDNLNTVSGVGGILVKLIVWSLPREAVISIDLLSWWQALLRSTRGRGDPT
jgi:hypothetical protein